MSKSYSKEQATKLKLHTFATTTNSGASIVRAYLKESAAKRLGVTVSEVYSYDGFVSSVPCDELVEIPQNDNTSLFEIRMREN